jgi:hypothetical protein
MAKRPLGLVGIKRAIDEAVPAHVLTAALYDPAFVSLDHAGN